MLEGAVGPIEALLQSDEHDHTLVAVVCHPHPLYGGISCITRSHRVASTLQTGSARAAVLRFNFRGVGKSAGVFDRGEGELADGRTALRSCGERYLNARRWAAGSRSARGSRRGWRRASRDIERLILIAPPVHTQTFEEMKTLPTPKLVVQGTADDVCKPENLGGFTRPGGAQAGSGTCRDASHFFRQAVGGVGGGDTEGIRWRLLARASARSERNPSPWRPTVALVPAPGAPRRREAAPEGPGGYICSSIPSQSAVQEPPHACIVERPAERVAYTPKEKS